MKPYSRRAFLAASVPASLLSLVGCGSSTKPEPGLLEKAKGSRSRAVQFLLDRQSGNGSWQSDVYGTFKDGTALTPLVLTALLEADADPGAIFKGIKFLNGMVSKDNKILPPSYGFDFALYTAALSVTTLSHSRCPSFPRQRQAWLDYLKRRQLTEALGWQPGDREHGGWGYSRDIPRKPKAGELIPPLTESNLSATTFALEAIAAAGVPKTDPLWQKALAFVHRCQNWAEGEKRDQRFDDGGFFFIYDDPVRNKAGALGKDGSGRERYRSYGSATCDGYRCLLYCGAAKSSDRAQAARQWLVSHFAGGAHPGDYAKAREMDRQAVYYYYASSFARCPVAGLRAPGKGGTTFYDQLIEAFLSKQKPNGSWSNPAHAVREDDPIVATAFALRALCPPSFESS